MIAAGLVVLGLALGVSIVRWVGIRVTLFEFAAAAVLIGTVATTWLMLLPSLLFDYAVALPIGTALVVALAALTWVRGRWNGLEPLSTRTEAAWTVVAVLSLFFWLSLNLTHDVRPDGEEWKSTGSVLADFGLHVNLILHQAYADGLPGDLPVASGAKLSYPFLVDFHSALLVREGWTLYAALVVPGTLLAWSITQLLIGFGRRLFGSFVGALIGTLLVFCGGSFAGIVRAAQAYHRGTGSAWAFLTDVPEGYAGSWSPNAPFFNPVADLLLPQRAFLFGLGVWLCIAILWHRAWAGADPTAESEPEPESEPVAASPPATDVTGRRGIYVGGVLFGLLPMAHAHSFVAAGALFAGLFVWVLIHRRSQARHWLAALGIALVLATPQLVWQQTASNGTGGHWVSLWTRPEEDPALNYLWRNFGVFLLLLIGMTIALTRRRFARWRPWLVPFVLLFVGALFYSMQPLAYDNLKLLFYVFLMTMLAFGGFVARIPLRLPRLASVAVRVVAASVVFALVCTGGLLTILREYQTEYTYASADDLAMGRWVKQNTSVEAVFAGRPTAAEPAGTVAGRRLLMADMTWLLNYNLDAWDRKAAVEALLRGDMDDPAVARYRPDYLAVSVRDAQAGEVVDQATLDRLPVAFRNSTWTVYRLR